MITGANLRDALISAANNVKNNRKAIDALNVFPVPDGDTGTNMSMTISSAAREISVLTDDTDVGTVSKTAASAMLRGARGNSGVILSLIFRGISKGLKGCIEANGATMAAALTMGVDSAYKAVMKPTEGTILTVVREAAEKGRDKSADSNASFNEVWDTICDGAQAALDKTPDMLPVLKKAGVVDAGGQGLVYVFLGMKSLFEDGKIIPSDDVEDRKKEKEIKKSVMETEKEQNIQIKYVYSCEITVKSKSDAANDIISLKAYLKSIGDKVQITDGENAATVSLITNELGNAVNECMKYGEITKLNVENLRISGKAVAAEEKAAKKPSLKKTEPVNDYGFVCVASGAGIEEMFKEIGADIVVSGGQTMNPSTEDILEAVEATPAKTVFVFPNNKNIVMAAEQVDPLSSRKVIVLPTCTIPQGITAMLRFDPALDSSENHINMGKAIEEVSTGQITFAARDSSVEGIPIKQGQILGLEEGKITVVEDDLVRATYRTARHLCTKKTQVVTLFYGDNTTEDTANQVRDLLKSKLPDVEISVINGGQPVYHFIISVE